MADDRCDACRPDERPRPRRAVWRRDAEALVGEQHDAHLRRLLPDPHRVVPVGLQDGLRDLDRPERGRHIRRPQLHRHDVGRPRKHPRPRGRGGRSPDPVDHRRPAVPFPDRHARVLPVRVRGDHADPGARLGAREGQLQGVDPLRAPVDHVRVHGQRVPAVGRRLLCLPRRAGLLGRLRHPPVRGDLGLCVRGGDRAEVAARSRDRRAQQPAHGDGRRGVAVARLERLQRRRLLLRRRERLRGCAQHEPVHRGGGDGVDRVGLHLPRKAVAARVGERHDHGPRGHHAGSGFRERVRRDSDRRSGLDARVDVDPLPQPRARYSDTWTTRWA